MEVPRVVRACLPLRQNFKLSSRPVCPYQKNHGPQPTSTRITRPLNRTFHTTLPHKIDGLGGLSLDLDRSLNVARPTGRPAPRAASSETMLEALEIPQPHHLHVYAHKHNTHITLTNPNRDPVISVSAGNLGFQKAQRGTYDAAYQLGAYVMSRIQQGGHLKDIQRLELVMRGFGPGREALTKIIIGTEGMMLRDRVVRVTDATRLKFGGQRGKKPRRLG
ncbi:hypothetical protein MMC25_006649 [Agyrium rufum]|nr:hypothetical protein [Agyrium rufum]